MRIKWLLAAMMSAALLAALHIWALTDFLYWKYRWFDTPMHFLGGITIGLIAVALLRSWRPIWYVIIVAAVFVGWEVFEYINGIAVAPGVDYTWDTAHDILNDTLGAVLVYVVARYSSWKPEPVA